MVNKKLKVSLVFLTNHYIPQKKRKKKRIIFHSPAKNYRRHLNLNDSRTNVHLKVL